MHIFAVAVAFQTFQNLLFLSGILEVIHIVFVDGGKFTSDSFHVDVENGVDAVVRGQPVAD